jgi:hypothetical protein
MALKTVHTSDLSGRYIEDEGQLGRLVVREHPDLAAGELPVELEVLPDELEKLAGEESQFVGLDKFSSVPLTAASAPSPSGCSAG